MENGLPVTGHALASTSAVMLLLPNTPEVQCFFWTNRFGMPPAAILAAPCSSAFGNRAIFSRFIRILACMPGGLYPVSGGGIAFNFTFDNVFIDK